MLEDYFEQDDGNLDMWQLLYLAMPLDFGKYQCASSHKNVY